VVARSVLVPYYYPKLLALFNKFKDTDKATSPVIESYALGKSHYPSLFSRDYDLTLEIYELLQNPADFNEATHLARKEAERLRMEAEGLTNLMSSISSSGFAIANLIKELEIDIDAQKNWLYAHATEAEVYRDFIDAHKSDLIKAQNWAKGQIELETMTQNIPWKASSGVVADNMKYTHIYADIAKSRTFFQLEDGSIVVKSSLEQKLSGAGDLIKKYRDNANISFNERYYYIKLPGEEWAEMLFDPNNLSDQLKTLFYLAGKDLGKNLGRYVFPIEDIKILIDGKDFDGQDVSRWQAAGFLLLTVVPGSKGLKVVGKIADATVVVGTVIDPDMSDELRVTVVATGLNNTIEAPITQPTKVVDNTRSADGNLNYSVLDKPTVMRANKSAARPAASRPASTAAIAEGREKDMEYLDIPAFLRRQAD